VIRVPPDWEPVLNEEHDRYRWLCAADAIAIAHWPETRDILAAIARSRHSP
jgi:8-oxo-dGTP pyrophosphatase MutT (NUDIX family)